MSIKFFLNKKKVGFGLMLFVILNIISIWFINDPQIFIRNFLMKEKHIQTLGFIIFIYSLLMFFSFIVLLFRDKEALFISDHYLVDNSKFESLGKVYFDEIDTVKRIKKNSLEIVLKKPIFNSKKLNSAKKIVHMLNNWNHKNSIIISSSLLKCEINNLEKTILTAIENYRAIDKKVN